MRYSVASLEDQLLATLAADDNNFRDVNLDSFAGQVSAEMFFNPEYMQGFLKLLPFCLVSYQGRVSTSDDSDSAMDNWTHTLLFRFFTGAQSLRMAKESSRNAYTMLAAIYDNIHAKAPNCSDASILPGYSKLSGPQITTAEFNALTPFYEAGGPDEQLIVSLPGIVVYQTDFRIKVVA